MDNTQFFLYLLLMAGSTYLIRAIPFVAINRKIENRFVRSFLTYIPYTVLTAMTIPSALFCTQHVISAGAGLAVATVFGVKGKSLTLVAIVACATVFVVELFL